MTMILQRNKDHNTAGVLKICCLIRKNKNVVRTYTSAHKILMFVFSTSVRECFGNLIIVTGNRKHSLYTCISMC